MISKKGILLINIGSPASTDVAEVRRYLKKFLMDKEVIDIPWLWRWILVHLLIVPKRAPISAENYRKIWMKEGSPLAVHSHLLKTALQRYLANHLSVKLGMCNSSPSVGESIAEWKAEGIHDILAVPLFPQFAQATTGSVINEIENQRRRDPDLKIKVLRPFFESSSFIDSSVQVASDFLAQQKKVGVLPQHYLFSFHGLPEKQILKNSGCKLTRECCSVENSQEGCRRNCYRAQCFRTAELMAEKMKLIPGQWSLSFQSRFGRARWILPATDETLVELARKGIKNLAVLCPSFVADCIETLEEIGIGGTETFVNAGGEKLLLVPCVNSDDRWAQSFASVLQNE